jgi:glycine/D-amino acid oxidase-like deaminating enzyme
MSRTNSQRYDAAVIGGGIVGVSAAAYLAQAGLSVVLFERARLAAGASGRNSGAIQHPFDRASADLHRDSLAQYRNLEADEDGFSLPAMPAGLLVIGTDRQAILRAASDLAAYVPELQPTFIAADDLVREEPLLADGVSGCLLATGYPVAPMAATLAFARRAVRAGAVLREGERAVPLVVAGRVVGVRLDCGESVPCGSVLVAAGPWSHDLVPG